MRKLLLVFLFISTTSIFSQENSILITGKITSKKAPISDVHIINSTSKKGTITTDSGLFEISGKVGDSLHFSHLNYKNEFVVISEKNINKDVFEVILSEKTVELNEITLQKGKSIFHIDDDILQPNVLVNAKTLNLPYANTTAKKDNNNNNIVSFKSGGVISIDNLINSLNGNNRRAKLLKKMSAEDTQLSKIRKSFTDDFFITDLHIRKENINLFLNFCLKQNIISIYKKEGKLQLIQLLIDQSKIFPQKIKPLENILSKN